MAKNQSGKGKGFTRPPKGIGTVFGGKGIGLRNTSTIPGETPTPAPARESMHRAFNDSDLVGSTNTVTYPDGTSITTGGGGGTGTPNAAQLSAAATVGTTDLAGVSVQEAVKGGRKSYKAGKGRSQ